jgi:hypothetical protein
MPGFIKPQLATLKSKAPKGEQWLHEIKYDGYRVQVHLNRGRKKVYTRNGLDDQTLLANRWSAGHPGRSHHRRTSSSTRAERIFPNCRQS